jgi:hypothetical protein
MSEIDQNNHLQKDLESCRINPQEEVDQPPVAIRANSESGPVPSYTLGNFSMVIGKAKSKKTFLIGAVAAAAITGREMINAIQGSLPEGKRKVLYFDTEQSRYHANRTIKRITQLSGIPNPENLTAYGLRRFKPDDRLRLIEQALSIHKDVGLVFIDGGRDLLQVGINDEKSATDVTSTFLRWTEELEIHLIVVLHQNKNDLNARGHFGSECVNKAETTLSVTQDANNRNVSVVRCEFSRDVPFTDFAFRIDEEGMPESCDMPNGANRRSSSTRPIDIEESLHRNVLGQIFNENHQIGYGAFWASIQEKFGQEQIVFGISRAKEYVRFYIAEGWVDRNNGIYTVNRSD